MKLKKMANDKLSERIGLILDEMGISQAELSRRTGVTEKTISRWMKDLDIPKAGSLRKVAKATRVRTEWLEKNEGPMMDEKKTQQEVCEPQSGYRPLSAESRPFENTIKKAYRVLTSKTFYSKALRYNIDAFYDALEMQEKYIEEISELKFTVDKLKDENESFKKRMENIEKKTLLDFS